ncbi:hypothetical protein BRC79_03200, partial [Halobacteriales archaeon QH_8_67_27]
MAPVWTCDSHGFFEGDACPVCGAGGRRVLDEQRRRRLSKYLSGALIRIIVDYFRIAPTPG